MKKLLFSFITLLSITTFAQKSTIQIPANQSIEISYPISDMYNVNLIGQGNGIDVAVLSKATDKQIRGFGLGKFGNVNVMLESENKLVLTNTSGKIASILMDLEPASREVLNPKGEYIKFTLRNGSLKSIPLIIPDVMNPNLSPKSNSGVSLKIGQKIYYKKGGKRAVLLTVDESIKNGDVIEVSQLVKELKAQ